MKTPLTPSLTHSLARTTGTTRRAGSSDAAYLEKRGRENCAELEAGVSQCIDKQGRDPAH